MMKKHGAMIIMGSVFLALLLAGCTGGENDKKPGEEDSTAYDLAERHDSLRRAQDSSRQFQITEANKDSVLTDLSTQVLTLIKNQEYQKLDSFIHPTEGIRFSPYATVEPGTDKKFTREAFQQLITSNKNKKINWGNYDGSGNVISLTPAEYFKKFVYDGNFLNPKKSGVNTVFGKGNSINNLKSVYEGSDFTENYLDGTKKQGGMDWKSVRLVYKLVNGKYYLVGIVHDQWTI